MVTEEVVTVSRFKIHTRAARSTGWKRFEGSREEAEAKATALIGQPASWNMSNGWPGTPNLDDLYLEAWIEEENELDALQA